MAILESGDQPHTLRMIQLSVGLDRGLPGDVLQLAAASGATRSERTTRILDAVRAGDADRLVAELDEHRGRALAVLRGDTRRFDVET